MTEPERLLMYKNKDKCTYVELLMRQEIRKKYGLIDPQKHMAGDDARPKMSKGMSHRNQRHDKFIADTINHDLQYAQRSKYWPCIKCGAYVTRQMRKLQRDKHHGGLGYVGLLCHNHFSRMDDV